MLLCIAGVLSTSLKNEVTGIADYISVVSDRLVYFLARIVMNSCLSTRIKRVVFAYSCIGSAYRVQCE